MTRIIEVMENILLWVEARSQVEAGIRNCRMSLFWHSQSHCLWRRRKDVSKLKIRPLEEIKICDAGTLPVLTTCINEILENLPPFGQDLCQIWYHKCTVMTDVMDGFYKKTPTCTMFAFLFS